MHKQEIYQVIRKNVELLANSHAADYPYIPLYDKQLPSSDCLRLILEKIQAIMFPGYFGNPLVNTSSLQYHTGVNLEQIYKLLSEQIYFALSFEDEGLNAQQAKENASDFAATLIDKLPEIKRLLSTDVKAIFDGDPAAKSFGEIIFCYPAMRAMLNHRVAHELLLLGVPLIPRIMAELAHAETGIDIHPGAQIGEYFSIDHGTGVVIGQTAIIGKHVRLYQGVTLGAKSFSLDDAGNPIDTPRHPILEDHVTVYSNSSILGRIIIGEGTTVGGNVWLTHSVPPNSKILQSKAVESYFSDGLGI